MGLWDFIKNALNAAMDGDSSFEKWNLIKQLNKSFKEQFDNGEAQRWVEVSVTKSDSSFKHSMSNYVWSGFKLTIKNDEKLKVSEANEISKYILMDKKMVRILMRLGFDTLIIKGKSTDSITFKLSDYGNLDSYFVS